MKMKTLIGMGLACAACCAAPLLGLAGLTLGSAGIAASLGVSRDFIFCVLGPLALAAGVIAFLWNSRRLQACVTCPTDKSCGCA